jgi:hypothetical protein
MRRLTRFLLTPALLPRVLAVEADRMSAGALLEDALGLLGS